MWYKRILKAMDCVVNASARKHFFPLYDIERFFFIILLYIIKNANWVGNKYNTYNKIKSTIFGDVYVESRPIIILFLSFFKWISSYYSSGLDVFVVFIVNFSWQQKILLCTIECMDIKISVEKKKCNIVKLHFDGLGERK